MKPRAPAPAAHGPRRGFSMVELLIAMVISSLLLTATLAALDASFKSYKATTESASSHVVLRLVMQRLSTLIRTGEGFGPYPANAILTPTIESDFIEFLVVIDPAAESEEIWRIETVAVDGATGPFELRSNVRRFEGGVLVRQTERTLIRRVERCLFTLDYDIGPRLRRATIDLTIMPDDVQADAVGSRFETPALRMVHSVAPRRLN